MSGVSSHTKQQQKQGLTRLTLESLAGCSISSVRPLHRPRYRPGSIPFPLTPAPPGRLLASPRDCAVCQRSLCDSPAALLFIFNTYRFIRSASRSLSVPAVSEPRFGVPPGRSRGAPGNPLLGRSRSRTEILLPGSPI